MRNNFGYIRVAAATPSVKVADCDYNTQEILKLIDKAEKEGVSILCFPELSVTAYSCGDLFHQQTLLQACESSVQRINQHLTKKDIIVVLGLPLPVNGRLFNAAAVLYKGAIEGFAVKTYLLNYGEFYEMRWFAPADELTLGKVEYAGQKNIIVGNNLLFEVNKTCFAIEICEDIWTAIPPSSMHALHGAELIFNLSASNAVAGKHRYRKSMISQQSARTFTGYIYASSGYGESSTDSVYPGCSMIAENGQILIEEEHFRLDSGLIIRDIDIDGLRANRMGNSSFNSNKLNFSLNTDYLRIDLDELKAKEIKRLKREISSSPFVPQLEVDSNERCSEIFNIQVAGLVKRLDHIQAKTAVIGISGGLDSTLALLVLIAAFDKLSIPRKGIYGITMPGFGTTKRTYGNAISLMKDLDITPKEIAIDKAVIQHFKDIGHDINNHDITYENSQARERTQILMDYANKVNGLVIGTGDLSELALGWCTYNGDHMSMYAVNSGVPKTLVRTLTKWIAENRVDVNAQKTLRDVIATPVSPELLPADKEGNILQKTEELVGPYDLHDFFLYHSFHGGSNPSKLYFLAQHAFEGSYDNAEILKWMRTFYWRFFSQQFKRSCIPDGPKVGSVNLSPRGDWKMPSDASVSMWMKELESLK